MNLLVNKTDFQPYTFVGPTVTRPVQDPLAVLRLDNQLFFFSVATPQGRSFNLFVVQVSSFICIDLCTTCET